MLLPNLHSLANRYFSTVPLIPPYLYPPFLPYLDELVSLLSADRFHPQTGRVCMADDDGESVARLVRAAHSEGENA